MDKQCLDLIKVSNGRIIPERIDKIELISIFNLKGECLHSQYYPCNQSTEELPKGVELFVVIKKLFEGTSTLKLNLI